MFGFISSCIKPVSHIESYLVGRVFTVPTDADSNPETKITTAWVTVVCVPVLIFRFRGFENLVITGSPFLFIGVRL